MLFATPDSTQYIVCFCTGLPLKQSKSYVDIFLDVPSKYLSWECIFHDRARVKFVRAICKIDFCKVSKFSRQMSSWYGCAAALGILHSDQSNGPWP